MTNNKIFLPKLNSPILHQRDLTGGISEFLPEVLPDSMMRRRTVQTALNW